MQRSIFHQIHGDLMYAGYPPVIYKTGIQFRQ